MIDGGRFYQELGSRIQQARRSRGLRQEDVAAALSLTRGSIANIERGRQRVLAHTLAEIALLLGVSPSTLLPESKVPRNRRVRGVPGLSRVEREWVEDLLKLGPGGEDDGRQA